MVLPASWSTGLILLVLSILCFALWPYFFKLAGPKWPFEFFAIDFAVGAVIVCVLAAYTLGTMGSALDFGDAMLVAGRRAEAMAFLAGSVFAFGNLLYLGTIALIGLANATLLVFGVFGCLISLEYLHGPRMLSSVIALVAFAAASAMAVSALRVKHAAPVGQMATAASRSSGNVRAATTQAPKAVATSTKAIITGILGGLVFAAVAPTLALAEEDQLSIGAYGGMLMASLGLLAATLLLSFFFLNVAILGSPISFASYRTANAKNHLWGLLTGFVWAVGGLSLYMVYSGHVGLTNFHIWLVLFLGILLILVTGLTVWRNPSRTSESFRLNMIGAVVFAVAAAVLVAGFRV